MNAIKTFKGEKKNNTDTTSTPEPEKFLPTLETQAGGMKNV